MLNDFGEYVVLQILFKDFPINSLSEVFPLLPVIAIILLSLFSLKIEDASVKNFKVSLVLICFLSFLNLSVTASEAPFLKASLINKFPSLFFPLIAKKISFLLISLELIEAFLNFNFVESLLELLNSFKIFNLRLLESV